MSSPIDAFYNWMQSTFDETTDYQWSKGPYTDSEENVASILIAVVGDGGSGILPGGIRRAGVRVLVMTGKEDDVTTADTTDDTSKFSTQQKTVDSLANSIIDTIASGDYNDEEIAQLQVSGDLIGPNNTTDGRYFYELNLTITRV